MLIGMYSSISGMRALEKQVEGAAHNTANVNTDGFKKTRVSLLEGKPFGVTAHTERINTPGPQVYETTASGNELVEKSNVDLAEELPTLSISRRYYQANIKTLQVQDEMLGSLLDVKG